jgi:hypothetical protein
MTWILQDGRVCRIPFSIVTDKLDLNKSDTKTYVYLLPRIYVCIEIFAVFILHMTLAQKFFFNRD